MEKNITVSHMKDPHYKLYHLMGFELCLLWLTVAFANFHLFPLWIIVLAGVMPGLLLAFILVYLLQKSKGAYNPDAPELLDGLLFYFYQLPFSMLALVSIIMN